MEKRQLLILFICSLVPWTVGNGVLPLLPVYAIQLGASSAAAGAYLAISYVAIMLGALSAGWISDRLRSRRIPLVISGAVGLPVLWLMGLVSNLWQLIAATAVLWFLGGMGFALTSILAGLFAGREERGKVFGVLSLAGPVGMLIGGMASGPLVDRWGFPTMFAAFALFCLIWPLAAWMVKDMQVAHPAHDQAEGGQAKTGLGWVFWLFFIASLAPMVANFAGILGRSLAMDELEFSASAISSTNVVAGLVVLPVGLLSGVASDRFGRKWLLLIGFFAEAFGLGLLAIAQPLWQFWLVISLTSVQTAVSGAVGSALVADLVDKASLSKAMSYYSSNSWLGGVIGFAVTGLVIGWLGFTATFLLAALLPVASIVMLRAIRIVDQ